MRLTWTAEIMAAGTGVAALELQHPMMLTIGDDYIRSGAMVVSFRPTVNLFQLVNKAKAVNDHVYSRARGRLFVT